MVEKADSTRHPALGKGRPFLEFEPAEYGGRHARAAALMAQEDFDALVLAEPANVRYFTGLRSWFTTLPPVLPIVAVITHDPAQSTIVDTTTEKGSVEDATWIETPELYGAWDDPVDVLVAALKRRKLDKGRLGLELGPGRLPHISPADLEEIRLKLPDADVVDASRILHASRAIKSVAELVLIRRAVDLIVRGFKAACESLRAGLTEIELTSIAAQAIISAGGAPDINPGVFIFMAGAERYRLPLLPATDRPIAKGELISLDGGCSVQGYHSDFARAAVIGSLASGIADSYQATVAALESAEAALGPGRPLANAWTAAQSVLDDRGLGAAAVNPRNIGHSIGLDHWEQPTVARPDSEMGQVTARPGMVICVEPQVAGAGGDDSWSRGLFLVEDQILITRTGIEILTGALPRDLYVSGS